MRTLDISRRKSRFPRSCSRSWIGESAFYIYMPMQFFILNMVVIAVFQILYYFLLFWGHSTSRSFFTNFDGFSNLYHLFLPSIKKLFMSSNSLSKTASNKVDYKKIYVSVAVLRAKIQNFNFLSFRFKIDACHISAVNRRYVMNFEKQIMSLSSA